MSVDPRSSTAPSTNADAPLAAPLRTKLLIVGAIYFAQGFPFGIYNELFPSYLSLLGVSLQDIGLLSAVGAAWTFKFAWAPLVDRVGTRRQWMVAVQLLLAVVLFALAVIDPGRASREVWLLLAVLAVLSATQDIAIDAYSIELLEHRELGAANGVRVTAYRVALIVAGGLLVALAGPLGWQPVFFIAAGMMLALAALSLTVPTRRIVRAESRGAADTLHQAVVQPLRQLMTLPAMWATLLFILVFKLGDFGLLAMTRPFWARSGYGAEEMGLVLGTLGMVATIAGALLGGALTTRWGTFRALWVLGLVQGLSNLGYWVAALTGASAPFIYSAAMIEQFTGGLGTAAFLAFMMTLCDRRFAATQYALLSALFGLCRVIAGTMSGFLAEGMGFANYFLLTFAMAFPAFLLLPWVRKTERAVEERVTA